MRTSITHPRVATLMAIGMLALASIARIRAAPDVQIRELPATPLEAFVARPSAMVVWASPIGRVESAASRAIVTVLAVEDREPQGIMRGLRIDLMHLQRNSISCSLVFVSHSVLCARPNAAIFFEEDVLERVRDGIARGNAEGSLIISYSQSRLSERTTGLIVGGYRFEGRQPAELAALVERGISELKNAPR